MKRYRFILLFGRAAGILPSRLPMSQPPGAGAGKAGRICGHRRLGLDRPEHGGTLVRTGTCIAPAGTSVSGDYDYGARATLWRSMAHRL